MKMVSLDGVPLDRGDRDTLLEGMRRLADYIYFEGPLLSHFKGPHGTSYFRQWCDTDDTSSRWMLFEVTEEDRLAYLHREKSLRELMTSRENILVYFIHTTEDGEPYEAWAVPRSGVPQEYLPTTDSYYDFEPVNLSQEAKSSYTILIDSRWSLADLGEFRSLYERAYSFIYALNEVSVGTCARADEVDYRREVETTYSAKVLAQPDDMFLLEEIDIIDEPVSFKDAFSNLPWKGGFSSWHFFNGFVSSMPINARPEVTGLRYASPGWIELNLSREIALKLRNFVAIAQERRQAIQFEIANIHDELRNRGLLGKNGRGANEALMEDDQRAVEKLFQSFSKSFQIPFSETVLTQSTNALAALKIVLSFTRMIWRLADFGSGNKVRL